MNQKRLKLASVFLLGTIASAAFSLHALASPPFVMEISYFSDPAHENYVGFWIRGCDGHQNHGGQVTPYYEVDTSLSCF